MENAYVFSAENEICVRNNYFRKLLNTSMNLNLLKDYFLQVKSQQFAYFVLEPLLKIFYFTQLFILQIVLLDCNIIGEVLT